MSEMDLLTMLGIDAGEPPVPQQGKKASGKGKGNTSTNGVKEKAGKVAKPTSSAVRRFESQSEIRKMLVGLDWTVHYAMHSFRIEDLSRQLVEMDASADLDSLKATLWAMVPQDVKDDLEKARVARSEAEAAAALGITTDLASTENLSEKETDEEDDMEFDEESSEMKRKKPESESTPTAPQIPEVQEGELTVDMIRLALSLEYYEFGNEESVTWRVDKVQKRLIPSITAGKMGQVLPDYKGYHWGLGQYLSEEGKKAINYVASGDGMLYEVRETDHLRIAVPCPTIRELPVITPGATLKRDKIPGGMLKQTVDFFRHFTPQHREALLYVTWNRNTGGYELHCPEQWVNAVTVEADYNVEPHQEIVLIMHSHHVMEAMFSGVDDRNDKALCIYGVFGRLDQPKLNCQFRAGFNDYRYPLMITDVFDVTAPFGDELSFTPEWVERVHNL
jgi:PRTRC genetic system protein A